MKMLRRAAATLLPLLFSSATLTQTLQPVPAAPLFNLSEEPVLYTVGYAHLDTEWRWDYETTVREYLKNTLDDNFTLLERYKPYVFTFSGARRYRMMKEYYPDRYERMKQYVAKGRWFVGGSSVDECDVNVPSPESVIRQVLYGNAWFRSEFGKESVDFLLPDCFGFPAHLPSVLAHSGLKGFSTQKLSWGSANGIPFNIGTWKGPDGKGITAALNATDYTGRIQAGLDTSSYWWTRISDNGKKYGLFADYRYYGVGDVGGAPRTDDVKNAIASKGSPGSKFNVYLCSSDQLFRDLTDEQRKRLPEYSGDLLLTEHSAGSLTSQASMKRWNRKNEQLAQSAEAMAVMASWLGAIEYPRRELNEAWWLVLGSQMHDILPGTSIPKAYEYAWNDEALAMNGFAASLKSSAGAVIRAMDTRGTGRTLVVWNPLAILQTGLAEAELEYPAGAPRSVRVIAPDSTELPVQLLSASENKIRILFRCTVPPVGLACFDVIPGAPAKRPQTDLSAGASMLDNELLKVTIDKAGNIASIIDKKLGRELLAAPARLEFQREHPAYWPAWNMDWNDRREPPAGYVDGPASISLMERGPVRATLRIERTARSSVFTQYIQLAAGADHLVIKNHIRWQSRGVSLKASFPLTASNSFATYNLGLGTVERGNNDEKKYEVPSREWFDLTDRSGKFGVTVIEDCKFGSDKPDDHTLRLTLLHTPETNTYHDQATQDWGIHEVTYGIYSHRGDWREGLTEWKGRSLNQPLRVFETSKHPGPLGKTFSFASVSTPRVDIRAIKQAENGRDIIIRLQELTGSGTVEAEVTLPSKILKAWEVDGQERLSGEATLRNGRLAVSMTPYAVRSFAVQLAPPEEKFSPATAAELPLPYDQDVVSPADLKKDGKFDGEGISFPVALMPEKLVSGGIPFNFGPFANGKNNAVACRGQKIVMPKTGRYTHVYILASALTDTLGIFRAGSAKIPLRVSAYRGMVGQFDLRTWDKLGRISGLQPGYLRTDDVAWFVTHLHQDTTVLPYRYGYIFRYRIPAPPPGETFQFPDNESIKIFAVTLADNPYDETVPAAPLGEVLEGRGAWQPVLPASYVTDDMEQGAEVKSHSHADPSKLPGRLTMRDYADLHQPNGVTAVYMCKGTGADSLFSARVNSPMPLPALNDGMFELLPGDSVNDLWTREGEGRIFMDLQKEIEIDSIHLFTNQSLKRGKQSFSLWGSGGTGKPSLDGNPSRGGWKLIACVPPRDIWGNRRVLYTVTPTPGSQASVRYLLWVSEDSAHGPFYFREVDVFEKQK